MSELKLYYHIVPTNNGYVYLCQEESTGKLYLHQKTADKNPEALIFSSEQATEEWIEYMKLPAGKFKAEWFGTVNIIEKFSDVRCEI